MKQFKFGYTEKFTEDDLVGVNREFGGLLYGGGKYKYLVVQWIEDGSNPVNKPLVEFNY
ncbi:MAG: hypothetical protein LBM27_03105 [Lactobacillaceae bacterium]|jgi:hypothetical protein|nr:hypothetical protein [Lactobacillaceae bacterium]